MAALATVAALATRIPGGIAESDTARAAALLDDVSAMIRAHTGLPLVTDVPDVAVTVCLSAAVRAWHNPEHLSSEAIDDYSRSTTVPPGIWLNTAEQQMLASLSTSSGLWIQQLTRPAETRLGSVADDVGDPIGMYLR